MWHGVNVGGIIGAPNSDTSIPVFVNKALNSYAINLYGHSSDDGTQLSQSQMSNAANFTGFDFNGAWGIDPSINNGLPYLKFVFK